MFKAIQSQENCDLPSTSTIQCQKNVDLPSTSTGIKLWSHEKTKESKNNNKAARLKLIEIVGSVKIWAEFKNKYHRTKAVWLEVAYEMTNSGFNLEPGSDGAKLNGVNWKPPTRSMWTMQLPNLPVKDP